MTHRKAAVKTTANFESNLDRLLGAAESTPLLRSGLLRELGDKAISAIELHPEIGRRFFAREAQSIESRQGTERLNKRFGEVDVREFMTGDYVLLYSLAARAGSSRSIRTAHLLAIRHQAQVSFDFADFWHANREQQG